jgi:putative transposase
MSDRNYWTDLTDEQWNRIKELVPAPKRGGRPATHCRRHIVDAIIYVTQAGCSWRLLPKDFAPWNTVYGYFRTWSKEGIWERVHGHLRSSVREAKGRDPEPTAAITDSQTVKTAGAGGARGFDGAKLMTGRKRHLLVDTLGLLLWVLMTAADESDRDMAFPVLAQGLNLFARLKRVWADSAYTGQLPDWVRQRWKGRAQVEIVKRSAQAKGFVVQPKRWIIERTFAWLIKARRLVRDYEQNTTHSEAFIYIRMSHLMLRRLHHVN